MTATLDRRLSTDSISTCERSRTWSEDVQKHWNMPVPPGESLDQRIARYVEYFTLTDAQVQNVYRALMDELSLGLRMNGTEGAGGCSLRMLDTCVAKEPTGRERGVAYCLDFSGTVARAVRCRLEGNGKITSAEYRANIRDFQSPLPKGLMDKHCGAMQLFDFLAECVKTLMARHGDLKRNGNDVPVALSMAFPCRQRGLNSATLIEWTKAFETGRATADPVEGLDVVTLLDMAFWRLEINAKCVAVTNDCTSTLLAGAYEKPPKLPPCTVAFLIGVGLNGAYMEPNAGVYGYQGKIVNTELGGFDASLPVTDVDLEVDFADEGGRGRQVLEKMIAGNYLGEICRRLVVKVWQAEAPSLAWARQSLPTVAAALCVSDSTAELEVLDRVIRGLWDWETTAEIRKSIKKLFSLVFERSAGLAAVCIAALSKKSGRLQAAMGGVTVAIDGALHCAHPWFSDSVRKYLVKVLGEHTASIIHMFMTEDGAAKGAAIIAEIARVQNQH